MAAGKARSGNTYMEMRPGLGARSRIVEAIAYLAIPNSVSSALDCSLSCFRYSRESREFL